MEQSGMNFSLSLDQLELRETMADFARKTLNPGSLERDAKREFSRELWEKCARMNIFGLPLPEAIRRA